MDQVTAPPPLPCSAPIFPGLPTTTAKNITRIILLLSSILTGVGGWYAKEVEVDPETTAVISEKVNVPGLVTAGTGILGIMLGLFQQMQHTDQAKVAVTSVIAAKSQDVAVALASPPMLPDGTFSVRHTLNTALTQASQERDFATAGKLLDLLKAIPGDGSVGTASEGG